jgi:hypothetical protein
MTTKIEDKTYYPTPDNFGSPSEFWPCCTGQCTCEEITKGMIVEYFENGHPGNYRVSNVRNGKANLKSIFGKHIYHKNIPVEYLRECESEWYAGWQQSDSYMCM